LLFGHVLIILRFVCYVLKFIVRGQNPTAEGEEKQIQRDERDFLSYPTLAWQCTKFQTRTQETKKEEKTRK